MSVTDDLINILLAREVNYKVLPKLTDVLVIILDFQSSVYTRDFFIRNFFIRN